MGNSGIGFAKQIPQHGKNESFDYSVMGSQNAPHRSLADDLKNRRELKERLTQERFGSNGKTREGQATSMNFKNMQNLAPIVQRRVVPN